MNQKEGENKNITTVDYRLYPNSTDEKKMDLVRNYCGYLYNLLLEDEIGCFTETGKKRSVFDLKKRMTVLSKDHPETRDVVYSTCRQNVATRVHRAMKGCYMDKETGSCAANPVSRRGTVTIPSATNRRMGSSSSGGSCICPI